MSKSTLATLEELGVRHNSETLNVRFEDYGFGNKIFACAHAEQILTEDVLVFVDSDTLITGEPDELKLEEGVDAAARPGVRWEGGISSLGPQDSKDVFWRKAYEICGLSGEPYVESVVDRKRIRAYFNAGLIAVRRRAGLFAQWKADFLRLMEMNHTPPDEKRGIKNMDEITLGLTLGRAFERLKILDDRYNYPLHRRSELAPPQCYAQLEDLKHVHYHGWFNKPGYLREIKPPLNPDGEIMKWLEQFLPFEPLME